MTYFIHSQVTNNMSALLSTFGTHEDPLIIMIMDYLQLKSYFLLNLHLVVSIFFRKEILHAYSRLVERNVGVSNGDINVRVTNTTPSFQLLTKMMSQHIHMTWFTLFSNSVNICVKIWWVCPHLQHSDVSVTNSYSEDFPRPYQQADQKCEFTLQLSCYTFGRFDNTQFNHS